MSREILYMPEQWVDTHVDSTSWNKRNASLRLRRLVFIQELKLVVLVLKVSDVPISAKTSVSAENPRSNDNSLPFPGKIQAV
jgi:hypothetical protein